MPRSARKQSKTGIYHVMLRGINRQDIFERPEDYWKLIETLASLGEVLAADMHTKQCACHIYAYCLMPNHVHLLIHERDWSLAQCIKYIADKYVRYYNKEYGRVGHLFQDRFKSEPCDTSDYFIVLMRYIHQNPVKAGLVKRAEDYDYSSWANDYLRQGSIHVCETEPAIRRYSMKELTAWVNEPLPQRYGCIDIDDRKVIADDTIRELILQKCGCRNITEFQLHSRERQKDIVRQVMIETDAGPRQMSRVSGMNYSLVYRIAQMELRFTIQS